MTTVVLYGRPGCCLCDDAWELLVSARERRPFQLEQRNIEDDDTLLRIYLERIPVVTIDGVQAFELFVDPAELDRRLAETGARWTAANPEPGATVHRG